jgi:hypothetical protein
MDFVKASASVKGLLTDRGDLAPARRAHKFTRVNDFMDLSALLRNFFALPSAYSRLGFISPCETKRFACGALSL